MIIYLNESQTNRLALRMMLNEYNISDGNAYHNPYQKNIDRQDDALDSFLSHNGYIMYNIENGKDYIIYELEAFFNIVGHRYCICKLIKDNEPYGSIYIKPIVQFKRKVQ